MKRRRRRKRTRGADVKEEVVEQRLKPGVGEVTCRQASR